MTQIGDRLGKAPVESIPNACEDWASTEATYRFCDNERVDPNEIARRERVRARRGRDTGPYARGGPRRHQDSPLLSRGRETTARGTTAPNPGASSATLPSNDG